MTDLKRKETMEFHEIEFDWKYGDALVGSKRPEEIKVQVSFVKRKLTASICGGEKEKQVLLKFAQDFLKEQE